MVDWYMSELKKKKYITTTAMNFNSSLRLAHFIKKVYPSLCYKFIKYIYAQAEEKNN